MHTYVHSVINTWVIHAYMQIRSCIFTHIHIHTYIHIHTFTSMHTCIHAYKLTTYRLADARASIHTYMHTHIHNHTHTYIHTQRRIHTTYAHT